MAVGLVNFAGNLDTPGGGFIARFDNTGTYQPTVGNLVLFACPNNFTSMFIPLVALGYTRLVVTNTGVGPFTATNVAYKIWGSGDNTSTILIPGQANTYIAYEFSGVNPSVPIQSSGFAIEQSFPVNAANNPTVSDTGSLALFLIWSQGGGSNYFPGFGPLTYDEGFTYDGFSSRTSGTGTIAGGKLAGLSSGAILTPTASDSGTGAGWIYEGATPIIRPVLAATIIISNTEGFYFPKRPQVSR
jgi:hypothetical protein